MFVEKEAAGNVLWYASDFPIYVYHIEICQFLEILYSGGNRNALYVHYNNVVEQKNVMLVKFTLIPTIAVLGT